MKAFTFDIDIKFRHGGITGKNKIEAIKTLKEIYKECYNIDLKDDEIKEVK